MWDSRVRAGYAPELHQSSSAYWATELPQLKPNMLLPRVRPKTATFPFDAPQVQYVHFARNAIFFLAQQMGLAGQEMLMPAYFHGVELEALLAAGVKPRFFAVRTGMQVDPNEIEAAITPATRAIYLIHYAGMPGPAAAVRELCRTRGLLFIEDCALALLSKAGEQPLGSFGDAAVFCLYKTLPTPDGGAVVMKEGRLSIPGQRPPFITSARQTAAAVLTHFERHASAPVQRLVRGLKAVGKAATRRAAGQWVEVGTQDFDVRDVNVLMSHVSHRIVAAQDFSSIVTARRRNFLQLNDHLGDLSASVFPSLPDGMCPLFYPLATPHKIELWRRLRSRGVQAVLFWLGGSSGPRPGEFPEVDALRRTVLELPCHQDMTPEHVERLAHVVRACMRGLDGTLP
ncbi:MAG TPA: DegT/DnrJ/EryC1/StrS family aminotransferase [Burkholderiales bacterium]|nr:DegT/DnrJ/EryC1/StrS family aminotransferase [Burkholderiales bacterium]